VPLEDAQLLTLWLGADDRFIIKEISRLEMDALLRFAPAYFEYMSKAIFQGVSEGRNNPHRFCH
jgi:hypothetical protein